MTATADSIIERRRLRRRVAFWRILAIVALLVAALAVVPWGTPPDRGEHVARVSIDGVILDDRDRLGLLATIRDAAEAKAVVVHIASPGGTVAGSEALYEALRDLAAKKPVVAVVGELAASGGYLAALGADRILARRNSITGSIGVISQIPNVAELLDAIGVSYLEVKSAPLKAAPSPFAETSPEAVAAIEGLILDSFGWFAGLVGERRGLDGEALARVTDGRVFTGSQAIALGLIDAIGGEAEARAWLAATRAVPETLPMRDYEVKRRGLPFPLDLLEERAGAWLPEMPLRLAPGPRLLALYTG